MLIQVLFLSWYQDDWDIVVFSSIWRDSWDLWRLKCLSFNRRPERDSLIRLVYCIICRKRSHYQLLLIGKTIWMFYDWKKVLKRSVKNARLTTYAHQSASWYQIHDKWVLLFGDGFKKNPSGDYKLFLLKMSRENKTIKEEMSFFVNTILYWYQASREMI